MLHALSGAQAAASEAWESGGVGAYECYIAADDEELTAAEVYGITDAEIAEAPDFRTVWSRFLLWVEDLLEMTVVDETDSENEEPQQTQLLSEPPLLLLGGHNSVRFDFPMLLAECLRHCVPCDCFQKWLYVDTLHIVGRSITHARSSSAS